MVCYYVKKKIKKAYKAINGIINPPLKIYYFSRHNWGLKKIYEMKYGKARVKYNRYRVTKYQKLTGIMLVKHYPSLFPKLKKDSGRNTADYPTCNVYLFVFTNFKQNSLLFFSIWVIILWDNLLIFLVLLIKSFIILIFLGVITYVGIYVSTNIFFLSYRRSFLTFYFLVYHILGFLLVILDFFMSYNYFS